MHALPAIFLRLSSMTVDRVVYSRDAVLIFFRWVLEDFVPAMFCEESVGLLPLVDLDEDSGASLGVENVVSRRARGILYQE
jgi:hypothetical protein